MAPSQMGRGVTLVREVPYTGPRTDGKGGYTGARSAVHLPLKSSGGSLHWCEECRPWAPWTELTHKTLLPSLAPL